MNNSITNPTIGLALGSGASRGWSHIGVIKALLREGIEPDIVCGTSVGAIIGGSYVAGNLEKLEDWVLGSTRGDVLRFFDIGFSQTGFVDTQRLSWFLHNYVAAEDQRIEDKMGKEIKDVDKKCEQRGEKIAGKVDDLEQNMNDNFRQLFVEVGKIQAKMP